MTTPLITYKSISSAYVKTMKLYIKTAKHKIATIQNSQCSNEGSLFFNRLVFIIFLKMYAKTEM